jgi:UDP-N-acetylmuramate dehydrogenase
MSKNEMPIEYDKKIYLNESLSKYSWFNLGGPAEIFFRPDNIDQLSLFFKNNKNTVNILGAGSNTLIRDGGIKGAAIKLSSKFSFINIIDENILEVGAATLDKSLSDFATKNSLTGFEFLACIPGSIGGGIIMNSGCYGYEISKLLISIKTMDFNGNINEISRDKINFSYRGSNIPNNLIILSAKLKYLKGNLDEIKLKKNNMIKNKKNSQPSGLKTCGSTFKNPKNKKAWELIKESDCDKMKIGQAKISEKHCNFFINEGGATSLEIEKLVEKVRNEVLNKTGTTLELEIKILGDNI